MFWGRLRQSAPVLCKKSLVSSQTAKIIASEMNKDGQSKKKINKCEIRGIVQGMKKQSKKTQKATAQPEEQVFTKEVFEKTLKKVSRKIKPSAPDSKE